MAVLSTAFANLAIATGFDRSYGVLKRLGATPLGRPRLVAAKTIATLAVLALQTVVIVATALVLGWRPDVQPLPAVGGVILATAGFTGLGLLLAGRLPALVNLAAANSLFIVLLLLSGMVFPLVELPSGLRTFARLLPSTALAEVLHGAFDDTVDIPGRAWIVLAVWAAVAISLASRLFRWDPDH